MKHKVQLVLVDGEWEVPDDEQVNQIPIRSPRKSRREDADTKFKPKSKRINHIKFSDLLGKEEVD